MNLLYQIQDKGDLKIYGLFLPAVVIIPPILIRQGRNNKIYIREGKEYGFNGRNEGTALCPLLQR